MGFGLKWIEWDLTSTGLEIKYRFERLFGVSRENYFKEIDILRAKFFEVNVLPGNYETIVFNRSTNSKLYASSPKTFLTLVISLHFLVSHNNGRHFSLEKYL